MKRIGLTGGIASGKSLIVDMLRREHIPVIDADELSREVTATGGPGLADVLKRFGAEYALPDGSLDRKKLAELIFKNATAREDLEKITHPLIGQAMLDSFAALESAGHAACVYCAPLIFEKNLEKFFDAVLLVYCDEETQVRRLIKRDNLTLEQAQLRISSQIPLNEKRSKTIYQIDNSNSPEESAKQLSSVWEKLTDEARIFH